MYERTKAGNLPNRYIYRVLPGILFAFCKPARELLRFANNWNTNLLPPLFRENYIGRIFQGFVMRVDDLPATVSYGTRIALKESDESQRSNHYLFCLRLAARRLLFHPAPGRRVRRFGGLDPSSSSCLAGVRRCFAASKIFGRTAIR